MDTYSFISENGVIREIADLQARDKNTVQDTEINEVTLKTHRLANYSETETEIGAWIDNQPVYRKVLTAIAIGETVGSWAYTGVTVQGAVTLVSARAFRKTSSYCDEVTWFSFRLTSDGRLFYYSEQGSSPLVNLVILEYAKS